MRQATNQVKIEGILAETDLKYTSFKKNGEDVEAIGGKIKILVNQEVNKVPTALEVPVYMFSSKYTKKGTVNPSYTSIEKVMNEFVSIAAAGSEAQADRVRITNADIRMNVFPGRDGIVSEPRIHASFVSKANSPSSGACVPPVIINSLTLMVRIFLIGSPKSTSSDTSTVFEEKLSLPFAV